MPVDPSSVIGYSLMGAGSGLVNRLMQHWFPTPLEKAQLTNIYTSLEQARLRLSSEEMRFAAEIDVRRELHLKSLQANDEQAQNQDLMRRWPLGTPASAIVRASQKYAGSALNLIILPVIRPTVPADPEAEKSLWQDLSYAVDAMEEISRQLFGSRVLCYREWSHPKTYIQGQPAQTPPVYPSGQALDSLVFSLTKTEPAVLVQASFTSEHQLRISWSCWGWAGDDAEPEPGNILAPLSPGVELRRGEMKSALATVACVIADRFHLFKSPASLPEPVFLSSLKLLAPVTFVSGSSPDTAQISGRDLLTESYFKALQQVAASAPVLASEVSAKAAIASANIAEDDLAERFTAEALQFVRQALSAPGIDDQKIFRQVFSAKTGRKPELRQALTAVRHLDPANYLEAPLDMSVEELLARLDEMEGLDPKARQAMKDKLLEMINYVPKIGVFGKSGVGKSSLCNALFGSDVCEIDDIEACTRQPGDILLEMGNDKRFALVDVPGVGENRTRDVEYRALYKKLLPELDILLWVLKGDDRAHSLDQDFYETLVRPEIKDRIPILFVINQVDKIEPYREWNLEEHYPGPKQLENINRKVTAVAELFGVKKSQIVPVSANEGFFLQELVEKIVMALPRSKRLPALRVIVNDDYVSPETRHRVVEDVKSELNGAAIAAGAAIGGAIGIFGGPAGVVIGAAIGGFIGGFLGRRKG